MNIYAYFLRIFFPSKKKSVSEQKFAKFAKLADDLKAVFGTLFERTRRPRSQYFKHSREVGGLTRGKDSGYSLYSWNRIKSVETIETIEAEHAHVSTSRWATVQQFGVLPSWFREREKRVEIVKN